MMFPFVERLGLWVQLCLIFTFAFVLYAHDRKELNGPWILDDKGTVSMNPAVRGELPWKEIWLRDFWGHDQLIDTDSHKSWRPLCSATYRLNYVYTGSGTFWFHVTDRLIHAVVSALVVPISTLMFTTFPSLEGFHPQLAAFICAIFFAAHPIHVEAVANTTGRAEVLCTLFYFLGFLAYAHWGVNPTRKSSQLSVSVGTVARNALSVVVMLFCSCCSMLCKEHGITLPVMACLWDAMLGTCTSIVEICKLIRFKSEFTSRSSICCLFLFRVLVSAIGTLVLVRWRLLKNGDYIPDFSCEQNPGACLPRADQRFLHFSWLWVLNFRLLVFPNILSPDWSGPSVDPMISLTDSRALLLPLLYLGVAGCLFYTVVEAWSEGTLTSARRSCIRVLLVAWWFMMITFIMSSNLFVYVGFVVADRTLYLPSFGFICGLVVLLFIVPQSLTHKLSLPNLDQQGEVQEGGEHDKICVKSRVNIISMSLAAVILSGYVGKQLAQTSRWADPVELWKEAYAINPNSCINGGELGMSLTNAQRPLDAVPVLWETHRRELESGWFSTSIRQTATLSAKWQRMGQLLTTRFKLVTALCNSGHCSKALALIDEAILLIDARLPELSHDLHVMSIADNIDERTQELELKNFRESQTQLLRNKAYLLVVKSRCSDNLQHMAALASEAVKASPQLPFAHDHAESVAHLIREASKNGLSPHQVAIGFEEDPNGGQVAQRTFKYRS